MFVGFFFFFTELVAKKSLITVTAVQMLKRTKHKLRTKTTVYGSVTIMNAVDISSKL